MNIHTPTRIPEESLADYRERRAASKVVVRRMTKGPMQVPMQPGELSTSRFFIGQHTNPLRNAQRKQMASFGGKRQMKRAQYLARAE